MSQADLGEPHSPLKDELFLETAEARPLRLLAEYLEPLHQLRREGIHDTIVFFGSARLSATGPLGRYYEDARLLAKSLTKWSRELQTSRRRFVVCSGGGPGIMEAANRGATEAGGKTIGLNIGLPNEQRPNPYITPSLNFEFRYFFMRKFWFAHLARALVVFPGGFGTLNELTEILMLLQTGKVKRRVLVLLYGTSFWKEVLNLDALVRQGMIAENDLGLFRWSDTPEQAFAQLEAYLTSQCLPEFGAETPAIAASTCSPKRTRKGPDEPGRL
ncbi:MAG TPA: TIGR00730 family Rossman fold protein [Planctomycetota bacterium]|nr:TIGR00730 family Rossman fold protein [Planctomycetota bacterium]